MLEVIEVGSQVIVGRCDNYREIVAAIKQHLSDYSNVQVVTIDNRNYKTTLVAICRPSMDSFKYEAYPCN